jgi:hypothetical protein
MATLNDIDTTAAVSKFLERSVVVNREDESADGADEIQAILESIAVTFLLYPQSALSFVLRAKNILQQIVTTDIAIIDYLLKAVGDIQNPSEPINDTSDLIEAQTALVEVDKLGRLGSEIKAYDRYTSAINRFLDRQLAKSLKRRRTGEFERTGIEAKQDIFRVLAVFGPSHQLMASRLELLNNSVDNFQSVDLTRIVATRTVTRVRSSLRRVLQGMQNRALSNTAVAIELLSGAAALESISNIRSVYDPAVRTGDFPRKRTIAVSSEAIKASVTSNVGPFNFTGLTPPWQFNGIVNPQIGGGTVFSITLPTSGANGRHWVKANTGSSTYNIPVGQNVLYVQFEGITPPSGQSVMIRAVSLPTGGAVTLADILTELNNVTTGLIDGTAVEMVSGSGRILIYGTSSVTRIVVKSVVPGTFVSDNYVPATLSVHAILGFSDEQTSNSVASVFTAEDLADFLNTYAPSLTASSTDDKKLVVESDSTALGSSLSFSGNVSAAVGFATAVYEAQPTYLELIENGVAIDPTSVGVYVGTHVIASDDIGTASRSLSSRITKIDTTKLFFDGTLPRCSQGVVSCTSPIVFDVQALLFGIKDFVGIFGNDALNFQRVLTPLISRPTLSQINDAKDVMGDVRDRLSGLLAILQTIIVRQDRSEFYSVVEQLVAALEDRYLDRTLDLLNSGQFVEFFAVTKEEASKSSRFMKAIEEVGRNDLRNVTQEQDIEDLESRAKTPDDDILPGEELSDPDDEEAF